MLTVSAKAREKGLPHFHGPHRVERHDRLARIICALAVGAGILLLSTMAGAQMKAQVRPAPAPAWNKGLLPISAESYYHAIECGKQGGDNPACVFWDTDLCKNDDFTLTWYSAYKQVAYEVWTAVQRKRPVPQPNYQAAQRTRVTIAIAPAKASKNALTDFQVKRGGKPAMAMERSLSAGGGRFVFDYPAFAPTAPVTLEMIGKERTLSCVLSPAVLRQLR
jgi:hypothetical protein